ncbi:MAG: hypothetical protein KAX11_06785 [Candidatus Aminicenantes bacterium]|nr:hypothetical protein [Candidatus Aminicenantes bacterium]
MSIINIFFGKLVEWTLFPFRGMSPWVGMIVLSLVTGIFMLFIFRLTSNQKGIKSIKNKIKAHILELRLFQDNLRISLSSQGKILKCNLKYISYTMKPMLIMIIPLILILIQMNLWFGYKSFSPDQTAILKVKLKDNYNPVETDITLIPSSSAIIVETLPLRIEEEKEIDWRFSVKENGVHHFDLKIGGWTITKTVDATTSHLRKLSTIKVRKNTLDQLFNPGEAPLPKDSPIKSIELTYPNESMNLFGWHVHWIIVYFALSVIFGFALKGLFGIEI